MSQRDWLSEIAEWKLEAGEEDNQRYFFPVAGLKQIQSGRLSYVLGRKGSGKTAVFEYVKGLASDDTFVRSLSFKNFPFNDLYKLEDAGYTSPSQYTTLWKYIIYSAVCSMMAFNEKIEGSVSSELREHFSVDFSRALSNTISKLTDRGGGLNIMGSGGSFSAKSIIIDNDLPWHQRVDLLEDAIIEYIDDSKYYILFDELDEDYKDFLEGKASKKYLDLIISLFKAVQDIRRRLKERTNVIPIVFLREDIYDLLKDNDKNKWRDSALSLHWSEAQLRELINFRLNRARETPFAEPDFNGLMNLLFTVDETRAGGARQNGTL